MIKAIEAKRGSDAMSDESEPIEDFEDEVSGLCPFCASELQFEDCNACGGEGWTDRDTSLALRCKECEGDGGWPYCPNAFCGWVSG